jgi:hypothetical protein
LDSKILQPTGDDAPFIPGFHEDVFISYRHIDNEQGQWVSKLESRLKAEVESILGERVRFWRDRKLTGGDVLDTTLRKTIAASAVFVPILSPPYVAKSSYCLTELEWFVQDAEQSGGLTVGTMSRIVPVVKYPPPDLPIDIKRLNPVRTAFFRLDSQSDTPFTFPADEDLPGFNDFFQTYRKLASDLKKLLVALKAARLSASTVQKKKTIFVAPVASDRKTDRTSIINYLQGKGYTVSGQTQPPESKNDLVDWVSQENALASIAIHLVGRNFGPIPEQEETGKKKSLVWLEFEQVRKSGTRQLLCVPGSADYQGIGAEQREFLAVLDDVGDAQTEIWRNSSEFFNSLPDQLANIETPRKTRDRGVYLICERGDLSHEHLKAIRAFLADAGIPVIQPAFQGDAALLRELETESVTSHDATLIYYGSAPDAWVLIKRRAVLKALDAADPGRLPTRALYLSEPLDDVKSNLYLEYTNKPMPDERSRFGPLWVFGDCARFHPQKLAPLLKILEGVTP